jgi:hypothetical protein
MRTHGPQWIDLIARALAPHTELGRKKGRTGGRRECAQYADAAGQGKHETQRRG